MKKIDVHCHYYPKSYLKELIKVGVVNTVGVNLSKVVWDSAESRIAEMNEIGIDVEVLGVSTPNVYFSDKELSLSLAQMTNDGLSEICRKYPNRFACLASIPLVDMKYAMEELNRATDKLGMDGILLGTNILGKPLDSEEFIPIFEEINRRKIPIFLHPMDPRASELFKDYHMASVVGFVFETTLTVTKIVLSGFFKNYPDIQMVLPHLGGTIPFLHARIDLSFQTYEAARKGIGEIGQLPSDYLKRFYYDTATSYTSSLLCTYQFAGADHILFGTDFPYTRGFRIPLSIDVIEKSGLIEEEKEAIFFRNVMKLLPRLDKG
jgi:predicted TIM-barrel fold metal-dependent hydrolase